MLQRVFRTLSLHSTYSVHCKEEQENASLNIQIIIVILRTPQLPSNDLSQIEIVIEVAKYTEFKMGSNPKFVNTVIEYLSINVHAKTHIEN